MSHSLTKGPWRVLVLDPDPADPKWIVATVVELGDVRPADPVATVPDDVTRAWVASRCRRADSGLTPIRRALVWRIDEKPPADGHPRWGGNPRQ